MIVTALLVGILIQILSHPLLKWPVYQVSLIYTKQTIPPEDWWHKVPGYDIYIGALPLKEEEHHLRLKKLNVTHIVRLLEPFEEEDSLFSQPVKKEDWLSLGITALTLDSEDFKPLDQETFDDGFWLLDLLTQDSSNTVYLHCKAGRGRSASLLLAFICLKRRNHTFEENYAFLKSIRPTINLRDDQKNAVLTFIYNSVIKL